jgi:hypothetical protein
MDPVEVVVLMVVNIIASFVLGNSIAITQADERWRKELLARDFAYYDPKTGKFRLKDKNQ